MPVVRREEEREHELRVPEERAEVVADEQVEDPYLLAGEARREQRATRVHCEAKRVARRGRSCSSARSCAHCATGTRSGRGSGDGHGCGRGRDSDTSRGTAWTLPS